MKVTTVGLDIAKSVFQVHGADKRGHPLLRKTLKRREVLAFFSRLEPCLIGMESCGSAHYWGRELEALGHEVKLIPAQFVKPFVKSDKSDANDAHAICEAVVRPTMRTVAIKNVEQQALLSLHRSRQLFVRSRTAQANQIRGLLSEFGLVLPQGIQHLRQGVPEILEDGANGLPELMRSLLATLHAHLGVLNERIEELSAQIEAWHQTQPLSQRLSQIPGIGILTATALVASIGDIGHFRSGRELAAWLGLVPRQHSSGGKTRLAGLSKRGDVYLRTLMIHGARTMVRLSARRTTATDAWVNGLRERRPNNVAVVARANKNARIVWALWTHGDDYAADHSPTRPVRKAA